MTSRAMRRILLALALTAACDSAEPPVSDDIPTEPSKDDSSQYTVKGARNWYLVGNHDSLDVTFTGPSTVADVWLDGRYVKRVRNGKLSLQDLSIGDHVVLLAAPGETRAFARLAFKRSYPLYVAVSNDWDTSDHTDDKLERQERLRANHPHLVITHFVGPYTFTDPALSRTRQTFLVDWLKSYEAKGDEIGLHVHPWCHFVQAAGVTCRSAPSFAKASDPTGYTVILGSYTEAELDKLFAKANELFVANGLAKPTSFRAGGWTATGDVLKALAKNGHKADASACNWARLEEWKNVAGADLYNWNKEHWSAIDETTQPYYPNEDDILADAPPHLPILEVPDNGALVDYVSTAEMVEMFRVNFDGRALGESRQYSIGYHPVNFSEAFFTRIDGALSEIDNHLAAEDRGPVVYTRMTDLAKAFPRP